MTRLRVMSNTGRPRRRGPFVFDVQPQIVDVDPERVFPANAGEAKQFGVPWFKSWEDPRSFQPDFRAYASRPGYVPQPGDPKVPPASDPNPPGKLIDLIMDDTDQWEDGVQIRHGGLIVIDVAADFVEPTELKAANAQLQSDLAAAHAELESLRSRVAARDAKSSQPSTGQPERLKRTTTPDDFGAPRTPAPTAGATTPASPPPAPDKPTK